MCAHLLPLENELKAAGIEETFRGQAWTDNGREWVYFNCYLDVEKLIRRFKFAPFIQHHVNEDPKSGFEEGLVCTLCNDAIIGHHHLLEAGKDIITFA